MGDVMPNNSKNKKKDDDDHHPHSDDYHPANNKTKQKHFVAPVPPASKQFITFILIVLTILSLLCGISLFHLLLQPVDDDNDNSFIINSFLHRHDILLLHFTPWQCYTLALLLLSGWIMLLSHLQLQLAMSNTHMPMLSSYLFLLGQAPPLLYHRPWDVFRMWHDQYGSVYTFSLFLGQLFVSIADPHVLKLVLQSKIQHVRKDVVTAYKPFLDLLGTGIVTSEEVSWRNQRVKMSHPLRVDILDRIPSITLAAVQRLSDEHLEQACDTHTTVDVAEALRHLTLQVISQAFLSLSAEESDRTLAQMYLPIVDEGNQRIWHPYRAYLPILPSFWRYQANVRRLNNYVSQLIQQRWQQRRRQQQEQQAILAGAAGVGSPTSSLEQLPKNVVDVLDQVLHHYELECRDAILPPTLSKQVLHQFRDEMKTFLLAGHETSAAMMTWTVIELLVNPQLLEQVVQEGYNVFGKGSSTTIIPKQAPPKEDLVKLVFTEACLKESLRKYSVVPTLTRRVVQDLEIPKYGFHIPKGTTLILNILTVHHDERYWPRPMEYNPKRFLMNSNNSSNSSNNKKSDSADDETNHGTTGPDAIQPFTFLPFIAGPRNCLGQYLSLLESKMVIALVMSRYQLTLETKSDSKDYLQDFDTNCWDTEQQDPRHRFMVPVVPKGKVMVRVRRRQS